MKLKVFKAFAATWAFLIQHGLDVLKIVWLPIVLQLAAFFALIPAYTRTSISILMEPPDDPSQVMAMMAPAYGQLALFYIIVALTSAPMFVALTRLVLRGEKPGLFYVGWGADEWRTLAGWAALCAVGAGLVIAFFVLGAITGALATMGPGPGVLLNILGAIIVGLVGIWIFVRLSTLTPATIDLRKVALSQTWERTEDEFWALAGFWAIWTVIAIVVQVALIGYLTPPGVFDAYAGVTTPDEMIEAQYRANEAMLKGYDLSDGGNITRLVVGNVIGFVILILTAIGGAIAWRMMTDAPANTQSAPAV
jgi:hypothetical protein